jgi:hypothetical protein
MPEFYERPAARNLPIGSDIDPQYPVFGNPLTATVRQNFEYAKEEIEELQRRVAQLEGDPIDGGVF